MSVLEIIMGCLAGLILVFLASTVFKMRMRTEVRLIVNSLLGILTVFILNLFRVSVIPLNLFNALLVGLLGIPGIAMIYAILHL